VCVIIFKAIQLSLLNLPNHASDIPQKMSKQEEKIYESPAESVVKCDCSSNQLMEPVPSSSKQTINTKSHCNRGTDNNATTSSSSLKVCV